jgi:hypothetical protein
MSDFFYDGQIRRYVTQFMRIFIGFKYQAGDGEERSVPVMYGDLTRQVASIIRENSENKLPTVPRIACYITGLEMNTNMLSDATYVSKVNIRERYYDTDSTGEPAYTGAQGAGYTVERLMPTPFKMTMRADIWTSNTDQKLQLLEQILILFNPSLEIQTTDNYLDWTSLTTVYLSPNIGFTSRSIPAGAESDIDICSLDFEIPVYITPPAKVKKLGIVRSIIANIFTEQGDIADLNSLVYNGASSNTVYINNRYDVLLFKSNNGQDYDYDVTIVDQSQAVVSLGLDQKEYATGKRLDWNSVLAIHGGFNPGSLIYFKQPNGSEIVGTFAVNPVSPEIMVATFDQDTIPANTVIASSVSGVAARGTIDAIVNPLTFNPEFHWGGTENIPLGTRYLLLETIGSTANTDGAAGWKGNDGSTQTSYQLDENDIVEWDGGKWARIFDASITEDVIYAQNLRTGIKYKWDDGQWLKAFEGEYTSGFWRLSLDP